VSAHRCTFTAPRGDWRGTCQCGADFDGHTYEATEDKWREHVWRATDKVPRPLGAVDDRWQAPPGALNLGASA
jgi:hypothetical protein